MADDDEDGGGQTVTTRVRRPVPQRALRGLPQRKRGRQTPEGEQYYRSKLRTFCQWMTRKDAASGFKVGVRGWCYLLEGAGVITKGEFRAAERLITDCRKNGLLPLDICAEDESRAADHVEELDTDDPDEEAQNWINTIVTAHERWKPISFWDFQDYYVEMAVEKLDLKNLFYDICEKYQVAVTNFKGWSDVNSRARMAERFKEKEAEGKRCVLLVCGDHDPGGLAITDTLRDNFEQISKATKWSPDDLEIVRFGLNFDFIEKNRLSWIDNLETSSGARLDDPDHWDHYREYVQSYLRKFGKRKCEANALVARPEAGRKLAEDAIRQYIDPNGIDEYEAELERRREELRIEINLQIQRIK
jgi:hypothetical protein